MSSTTYCQHAHRLRLVRPGRADVESERPRHKKTGVYQDGAGGTQVEIFGDETGFDLDFALRIGSIAPLPCADHPGEVPKAGVKGAASG